MCCSHLASFVGGEERRCGNILKYIHELGMGDTHQRKNSRREVKGRNRKEPNAGETVKKQKTVPGEKWKAGLEGENLHPHSMGQHKHNCQEIFSVPKEQKGTFFKKCMGLG